MPYSPLEITPILHATTKAGLILVGGQAINTWSLLLSRNQQPWNTLKPYTSYDVDAFCEPANLGQLIQTIEESGFEVNVELAIRGSKESVHNVALLTLKKDGDEIEMNCLRDVIGVPTAELKESSVQIKIQGPLLIQVMHPVLCLQSKLHNLTILDQTDRQDEKHLRLAVANLHAHLQTLSMEDHYAQGEMITTRVLELAFSGPGRWILRNYAINLIDSLPHENWLQVKNPNTQSLGGEVKKAQEELDNLVQREKRSEAWLESLNPKPHKANRSEGALTRFPGLSSKIGGAGE